MRLVMLVLAAIFARVPTPHEPTQLEVLQHDIADVSARVEDALSDLAAARTPAQKSRANAQLVDLRLELADLSDRVRVQSQR